MIDEDDRALSFLGRRLSAAFDARYVAIAPGARLACDAAAWHDELIVVERGEIELEGRGGLRRRFTAGDVLCFAGLSLAAVANHGTEPAVLSAISRSARAG